MDFVIVYTAPKVKHRQSIFPENTVELSKHEFILVTLRLHYVPGDHGSHGSPKRSAPCDLVNFCLGTQVLLSIITFRHGLSRYPLQTVG